MLDKELSVPCDFFFFLGIPGYPEQPGPSRHRTAGWWRSYAGRGPPGGRRARWGHTHTHTWTRTHRHRTIQVILLLIFKLVSIFSDRDKCVVSLSLLSYQLTVLNEYITKGLHFPSAAVTPPRHIMAGINWIPPCLGWKSLPATSIKTFQWIRPCLLC